MDRVLYPLATVFCVAFGFLVGIASRSGWWGFAAAIALLTICWLLLIIGEDIIEAIKKKQ